MRVVLCGKNDAAVLALEHLLAAGDEVWVLGVAGDDGRDGWQRSLVAAARRRGVRVDQPRRVNDPAFVEELAGFRADRLVSIQYDQILKNPLFERIGCACLNLHFALLPRHRGVSPIAFAILAGDAEAGVTLHHMVEDIDAGDVVAQRAVAVPGDMTARELYDALGDAAAQLFRSCHPFPPDLLARRLPQDARVASYHRAGDFDFSRREIDWTRPAAELQRWIRALIFPPMQYPETTAGGTRLIVRRVAAEVGPPPAASPGTVLASEAGRVSVAAGDGVVHLTALDVDPGGTGRVDVGMRLGHGAAS